MPATIKLGSASPDVSTWQDLLTKAGFTVPVTGTFDEATDKATKNWQASKSLTVDGVVGPASWGAMTGVAAAGKIDKNAKFGRDTLVAVWPRILEEAAKSAKPEIQALAALGPPNLSALQIAGAQARLESGYGLYQYTNKLTGEKSGVINNWGAVQAHGSQPGFLATDTHADGTSYNARYRIYDTPEDGAFDMLREMTIRRPTSWQNMNAGDIDAWSVSMRTKDPITGVGLYFEQSSEGRAKGIDMWVKDIAFTLNEPIAAVRGGPLPEGGLQPVGDPTGGGGLVWSTDGSTLAEKGFIAAGLLGLVAIGWRFWRGSWPWPF